MIYVTGDTHGNYSRVEEFCKKYHTTKNDLMIVLGDNGVNYYGDRRDRAKKKRLEALPITFMMIRGNHDMRPPVNLYNECAVVSSEYAGTFLIEQDFPSLLFTTEYGTYNLKGKIAYIIGGAYSVDKYHRLEMYDLGMHQYRWFFNEQLSEEEMMCAKEEITELKHVDYILSHTCPFKYEPVEMFLSAIDQSGVDDTMERWLDTVEESVSYDRWFCGHWHTNKTIDKMHFMYEDIIELE